MVAVVLVMHVIDDLQHWTITLFVASTVEPTATVPYHGCKHGITVSCART